MPISEKLAASNTVNCGILHKETIASDRTAADIILCFTILFREE